jgi:hypothetical protein
MSCDKPMRARRNNRRRWWGARPDFLPLRPLARDLIVVHCHLWMPVDHINCSTGTIIVKPVMHCWTQAMDRAEAEQLWPHVWPVDAEVVNEFIEKFGLPGEAK